MEANTVLTCFWRYATFVPFFCALLAVGIIKAVIIGATTLIIILIGNSSVLIGPWPAHVIWTYYCIIKTKKLGLVLKMLILLFLPVSLIAWPVIGISGSLLVGTGYGYIVPLVATIEAAGVLTMDKLYHTFVDGCRSMIEGACTVVRDCTDLCFHSYFAYMDDLTEMIVENEKPSDMN